MHQPTPVDNLRISHYGDAVRTILSSRARPARSTQRHSDFCPRARPPAGRGPQLSSHSFSNITGVVLSLDSSQSGYRIGKRNLNLGQVSYADTRLRDPPCILFTRSQHDNPVVSRQHIAPAIPLLFRMGMQFDSCPLTKFAFGFAWRRLARPFPNWSSAVSH